MVKKSLILCVAFYFLSFLLAGSEIHDAALNGDQAKVKELLAKDPALLKALNDNGRTPLHMAASRGHLGLAAWLVKKGSDINQKDGQLPVDPAAPGRLGRPLGNRSHAAAERRRPAGQGERQ